jgi:hypothetical protein
MQAQNALGFYAAFSPHPTPLYKRKASLKHLFHFLSLGSLPPIHRTEVAMGRSKPIPNLNFYDVCIFFPCLISNQCKSCKILVSAIINMNGFLYG